MSDVECVYVSKHEAVIHAWLDHRDQVDTYYRDVGEISKRWDGRTVLNEGVGFGGARRVCGLEARTLDIESPPRPLRYDMERDFLVPDDTAAGVKLAKQWADTFLDRPRLPGMPGFVMLMPRFVRPRGMLVGSTMWIAWGCPSQLIGHDAPDLLRYWRPADIHTFETLVANLTHA